MPSFLTERNINSFFTFEPTDYKEGYVNKTDNVGALAKFSVLGQKQNMNEEPPG